METITLVTMVGFFAALLTTGAFLPQAIKTIRTGQTKDLSLLMITMTVVGQSAWTVYGGLNQDLPVLIANIVALLFTVPILILKIKHK